MIQPATYKYIKTLTDRVHTDNVCIALDWLSLYFNHVAFFPNAMQEGDTIFINDECYLLAIDRPTLHFNKHLVLIYKKTECAHVLFDSRNEKFFKKDICKVEFINHTLYSGVWMEVYNLLKAQGLVYKATSRIDICIDGANYLHDVMNFYAKQEKRTQSLRLKNSSEIRARFSAKVLNPKTMNFENFTIGGGSGNKMITIYNKSLEIIKSGKTYIQDYWKANGVVQETQDLQHLSKGIYHKEKSGQDVVNVAGITNIYRFEIRLKSEAIKEIAGFNPEMLMHKKGLASIIKCHCKNYFELTWMDNKNVSRCTPIELLPYDKLEAETITKIERVEKDGLYKAKMLIHGIVQDIYKGNVQQTNYNESVEMIMDRVVHYRLSDYLDKKLIEWQNKYHLHTDKENIDSVIMIINEIGRRNNELTQDFTQLASRHDQAGATAYFGED